MQIIRSAHPPRVAAFYDLRYIPIIPREHARSLRSRCDLLTFERRRYALLELSVSFSHASSRRASRRVRIATGSMEQWATRDEKAAERRKCSAADAKPGDPPDGGQGGAEGRPGAGGGMRAKSARGGVGESNLIFGNFIRCASIKVQPACRLELSRDRRTDRQRQRGERVEGRRRSRKGERGHTVESERMVHGG